MKKKRKKIMIIVCVISVVLILLYFLLVNFLVSAALVPFFMRKLEAFERITDESYAAQVQTSDIKVNRQLTLNATEEWLQTVEHRKLSAQTTDGYMLIAEEFPAEADSHKWVLILHGYTGWKEEMYPFAYWYHEQGYHVIVDGPLRLCALARLYFVAGRRCRNHTARTVYGGIYRFDDGRR